MPPATQQTLVGPYFACQDLFRKAAETEGLGNLSPDQLALLTLIGRHWFEGSPLSVRRLMQMRELASPATVHKRLHALKNIELVDFAESAADSRKRMIVPGSKAIAYFTSASSAILQAAMQHGERTADAAREEKG